MGRAAPGGLARTWRLSPVLCGTQGLPDRGTVAAGVKPGGQSVKRSPPARFRKRSNVPRVPPRTASTAQGALPAPVSAGPDTGETNAWKGLLSALAKTPIRERTYRLEYFYRLNFSLFSFTQEHVFQQTKPESTD